MKNSKPVLYNGFKITNGVKVVKYIDRLFFTEIYKLSNDLYFYLFLELKPEEIIDENNKYNIISFKVGQNKFCGVMLEDYSKQTPPSLIKNLTSRKGLECVAGMKDLKKLLADEVIKPFKYPKKFKKFGVSIPNGILLYGPPGCGKTFIIEKLAEELNYHFFKIEPHDVGSSYIHGTTQKIADIFQKAKEKAPSIVFIDEIEGMAPQRNQLNKNMQYKQEEVNTFLKHLDNAADYKILVVGATNYINRVDSAILRPGRIDKKIYVSPPDFEARKELFKLGLNNKPHDKNIDFTKLAEMTKGYSSADIIEGIIKDVARLAVNLDKDKISEKMLIKTIKEF